MKTLNLKTITVLLILLIPTLVLAQKKVSGIVLDERGETLPGVNIIIKGTSRGTITDYDGAFSIAANSDEVVEASFMGFESREILVGNQTKIEIVLREASVQIQELEVVAVGYGDVRRRDLTGAIASADLSEITKIPVNNIAQSLGGRIAGVRVSSDDGGLGNNFSITIRGTGSLTQSTAPLYIIDGFPLESSNLGALNPNDIESIDVLKDASATAIYGSRGANGVVIISTKRGIAGRPQIEYNGNVTVSNIAKKQELLTGYQFVELQKEITMDYDVFAENYLRDGRTLESYKTEPVYDWQDAIYRTAITNNHYLSLSGVQGNMQYSTSGSYLNQEGIIVNSSLNRYQGRISLDQKLYENKLRVRIISNATRTERNGADPTGGATSVSNALMYSVWGYRPVSPSGKNLMEELYDDAIEMTEDYRFNPVLSAYNEHRKTITDNLSINGMIEYDIIQNLRLRTTGGYQLVNYTTEEFNNSKTRTGFYHNKNASYKGVNAYYSQRSTDRLLNENTLSYQFRRKGHNVNLLGGITFQKESYYAHDMTSTFITNEIFEMAGFGRSSGTPSVGSSKGENTLSSYLARVNYNYKYKYYATASFRADGSSKFSPKNRWGYFPSASLAWTFSREDFLKESNILTNGRLRLSYGQTGNNRVDNYAFRGMLTTGDNYLYPFDSNKSIAYIPSSMHNESLKWETTDQYNVGLDLGLWSDRVNIVVDYYIKNTRDLLLQADLAPSSGYPTSIMNIGELQNRGLEFSIQTKNIQTKDFQWNSSFNISFNKNEISKLNDDQVAMTRSIYWDNQYRTMPAYISPIGRSAGLMYGFLYEGTYKKEDFNITVNDNGAEVYTPKEGVVLYSKESRPGDPRYRDINNDGVINDNDKTIIGQGHPIAIGGLNNSFAYKNVDLSFFFQFSLGNDILNANRMVFENPHGRRHTNMFAAYADRWTENNPTSDIPRSRAVGSQEYSSLYIEDGSFIRLKSLSLGYNFQPKLLLRLHIAAARIAFSAENLLTFTSYSGNDPEVSTRNTVLTPGFDWSPYPRSRNYSVSLNLTF
ncbi:TonB-dependent receptor [Proteiniphilum sp. X52]|uniref:SusC/RagA family TonB-linked outer membrane protein n=1 Tax=Proteiniphilum sp. X52 TaxID=2382159 RepID=UPI000F0A3BD1|nr:TonB-dependent receptor [Proteiniphilum sp. X52]RNC66396.1 TonB-dependent receptor [Proteiniphilum sp. X52]